MGETLSTHNAFLRRGVHLGTNKLSGKLVKMDEGGRRGGKGREEGNNKMAQHPNSIGIL